MSKFGDIKLAITKKFEDEEFSIRMVYAATAAAIVIVGFLAGRLFLPIDTAKVSARRGAVMETDRDYLLAVADGKALNNKLGELEANNDRIESTFDDVIEYQKQYDKLKSEYDSVTNELNSVRKQLDDTRAEHNQLETSLEKLQNQELTLSPGTYTVGEQLFAGEYRITGTGTFLAAGKDKQSKANAALDKNEPFVCELEDGDTLKLSSQTKLQRGED